MKMGGHCLERAGGPEVQFAIVDFVCLTSILPDLFLRRQRRSKSRGEIYKSTCPPAICKMQLATCLFIYWTNPLKSLTPLGTGPGKIVHRWPQHCLGHWGIQVTSAKILKYLLSWWGFIIQHCKSCRGQEQGRLPYLHIVGGYYKHSHMKTLS